MTDFVPGESRAPEEAELLNRILRRFREQGNDYAANDAAHEYGQNFPEIYLAVRHAKPRQQRTHLAMLRVLDRFCEDRRNGVIAPRGLILSGNAGVGKTALACLLAHEAAALAGLRPSFIDCRAARRDLRGLPSERRRTTADYLDAVDPRQYPLCVVDDFGREKGNPEAEELVRDILDIRTKASAFTIFTTNLARAREGEAPGFYDQLGGEREASRASCLVWIDVRNQPDYRLENAKEAR